MGMSHASTPGDLDVAHIAPSLATSALHELLPRMMSAELTGVGSPPEVLEVGWSYYEANFNKAWVAAVPLRELPHLQQLLTEAMSALNNEVLGLERLNVICRRYTVDRGIALHTDVPDLFDEDVY